MEAEKMSKPNKKDLINTIGLWIMAFLVVAGCIMLIAIGKGEELAGVVLIVVAVVTVIFCA